MKDAQPTRKTSASILKARPEDCSTTMFFFFFSGNVAIWGPKDNSLEVFAALKFFVFNKHFLFEKNLNFETKFMLMVLGLLSLQPSGKE